ncbi:MAG: hypothetical protein J7518_00915 [Nocardioidaceae bacterium]|nr:hypothetical protein [Nocardioidaceae bacterium]
MGQDGRSGYVLRNDTPRLFTDGFAVLALGGNRPATLLKVESLGGESTFEFLGAKLAAPDRELAQQQVLPGWPPKGIGADVFDAENVKVQPLKKTYNESGYEILMGYRLKSDVPAVRTGIRITYRIGAKTYRAVIPSAFALCAPGQPDTACADNAYEVAGDGTSRVER